MGKIEVINHPLIQHKLSILRRTDTSTKAFRELVNEIAMLMGYEVLRDLPLEDVEIETPITKTVQKQLAGKKLVFRFPHLLVEDHEVLHTPSTLQSHLLAHEKLL